jgi:hypothetical protein
MVRGMSRRNVEKALGKQDCTRRTPDNGPHTTWDCPCGQHTAIIPRHNDISPGVIRDTANRLTCLPKGWLQ